MARNSILGQLCAALAISLLLGAVRGNADTCCPITCGLSFEGYPTCCAPPPKADLCCCDGDCDGQNCGSWVGGVDMLFLGSKLQGASVSATVDGSTTDSSGLDRFAYAPRMWLGYQGECWGLYGRFFHLDEANKNFDPLGVGINNSLTAYYTDLEAVRAFGSEDVPMYASFGVRYAALQSNASIWSTDFTGSTIATANATTDRSFFGTGITSGLWGKVPISSCGCVSCFWGARGSILWGDSTSTALTRATAIDDPAAAGSINGALGRSGGDMAIGELTLGVQWDHELKCVPATAFVRLAGEYQIWYDNISGTASANSTASAIGNVGSANASAVASGGDQKLQLYGFSFGTGFMW